MYKIEQMEPTPGSPAYYGRLAAQAPARGQAVAIPGGPPPFRELPLPPEALESNANKKSRETMERLFRQLNNPSSSAHRNSFKKKYGVNWSTIRNQKMKNFKNQQEAKAARRKEALERHKNAEWAAYIQEWRQWRNANPPGPGMPTEGDPIRILGGMTRKIRSSKKKDGVVKSRKGRKNMRSRRRS